jgi:hypothetical protein
MISRRASVSFKPLFGPTVLDVGPELTLA